MRKILMTALLAVMALTATAQTDSVETYKRLTGIPKPPVAGQTINFKYHPQGGPLEGMKDLVALMQPKYIEVLGLFTPRGGISIYPYANYGQPGTKYADLAERRLMEYQMKS